MAAAGIASSSTGESREKGRKKLLLTPSEARAGVVGVRLVFLRGGP